LNVRDKAVGLVVRLVLLAGLAVVVGHGQLMWAVQQRYHGNDFGKLYYGVQAWQRGESLYGVTPASVIPVGERSPDLFFRNLNPPHAHLLIWPLVALPLPVATWLWALLNLAALVAGAARIGRSTAGSTAASRLSS
jgi:hypothetical protein